MQGVELKPDLHNPLPTGRSDIASVADSDSVQQRLIGQIEADYDALAYESHAFPQTHPSKIGAIAKLYGINVAPVESARVLELGCASGGNIAPIALANPQAQVVGLDLSRSQILDGKRAIEALNVRNLTLMQANITALPDDLGQFDYIICHGVFSWVPKAVQTAIFDTLKRFLAPNGVGFVSYNVYPGWHFRAALRDMMLIHCEQIKSPQHKVRAARELLNVLVETSGAETLFGKYMRSERDILKNSHDSYIFHEYLEGVNEPMFFKDWVTQAQSHGLSYLSEAEHFTNYAHWLQDDAKKIVSTMSDRVMAEQYIDFFRNRTFRQSLLVRSELTPKVVPDLNALRSLHFAGRYAEKPIDGEKVPFNRFGLTGYVAHNGIDISITNPIAKAATQVLTQHWPNSLSFDELLTASRSALELLVANPVETDAVTLCSDLLSMFSWNTVELRTSALKLPPVLGDKPKALAWAQWDSQQGKTRISTLRHDAVGINAAARIVLALSDGARSRDQIADVLFDRLRLGTLTVPDAFAPSAGADDRARWAALRRFVESCLAEMRPLGLYVS
ncbi:MAG: methyltransferase domain-containing protein [Betaproteobacteria bacterium]|nr:MAG: methyltransferase domain-containing protein [Betaproteobacteria bacterium]